MFVPACPAMRLTSLTAAMTTPSPSIYLAHPVMLSSRSYDPACSSQSHSNCVPGAVAGSIGGAHDRCIQCGLPFSRLSRSPAPRVGHLKAVGMLPPSILSWARTVDTPHNQQVPPSSRGSVCTRLRATIRSRRSSSSASSSNLSWQPRPQSERQSPFCLGFNCNQ
jgi:hypothetical protein